MPRFNQQQVDEMQRTGQQGSPGMVSSPGAAFLQSSPDIYGTGYSTVPMPASGELREDSLLRMIQDQLSATRSRYNRMGTQAGATADDLAAALSPLQGQMGRLDQSFGALRGLTGSLVSSSLGSTAGASMAAVNAARMSGAGRYGGGGNAAMMVSRGATEAAVGQSAALSQALVQGQLGEAQYQSGILQQRGATAAALSQLLQSQAGLKEERGKLGVSMETELANILGGALNVYGGMRETSTANKKNWRENMPSIFGLF